MIYGINSSRFCFNHHESISKPSSSSFPKIFGTRGKQLNNLCLRSTFEVMQYAGIRADEMPWRPRRFIMTGPTGGGASPNTPTGIWVFPKIWGKKTNHPF